MNHLSNLPDDCLLDVLGRVNHDDLDEITTLSRKMHRLSELSRSRAVKILATELIVNQEADQSTHIKMKSADTHYVLHLKNNSHCFLKKQKLYGYMDFLPIPFSEFSKASEKIAAILARFEFERIDVAGIRIDYRFVSWFKRCTSSQTLKNICANRCLIDKNLNKERFMSWLLSIKPHSISLDFKCETSFFDDKFLRDYAQAVEVPSFHLSCVDNDHLNHLSPAADFAKSLSNYSSITMNSLVIDASWLFIALLKRLRRNLPGVGRWRFLTTTHITETELDAAMESDTEYRRTRDSNVGYIISISGTDISVYVQTSRTDGVYWMFSATF